jgi:hypothetical protein
VNEPPELRAINGRKKAEDTANRIVGGCILGGLFLLVVLFACIWVTMLLWSYVR